jgi:sugar lactone lactonase YvrE
MNQAEAVRSTRGASLLAALSFFLLAACGPGEQGDAVPAEGGATAAGPATDSVALTVSGFSTPESALFDERGGVYLVSNIAGGPSEMNGEGFISRVTLGGEIENLRWIDGRAANVTLNAPKGLALKGDTLIVTDIEVVRLFHRTTGQPLGDWAVPGATFLNDVAVGGDGAVYVTDTGVRIGAAGIEPTGTDAVHRFDAAGVPTALARGANLQNPNGIIVDGDRVIVVPFGSNEVYRLGPDGQRQTIATLPGGQLDGLVGLQDGSLLVTSWEASAVYRVSPAGQATLLVQDVEAPADIGWDPVRNRLLIPLFQADELRIQTIRR